MAKKCGFLETEFCTIGNRTNSVCSENLAENYYSFDRPAGCYRKAEENKKKYDSLRDIKKEENTALIFSSWNLGINNDL